MLATLRGPDGRSRSENVALNDVVLHKGGVARVVRFQVLIDGEPMGPVSGDGLVVASPTGSTAYSLSAGGPVVVPTLDAMIVTPICAHSLGMRPLVVPAEAIIHIEPVDPRPEELLVSFDGQQTATLGPNDVLDVQTAKDDVVLVRIRRVRVLPHAARQAAVGRSLRSRTVTLVSLRVRDLATIADVTLDLGAGLNVLTGETGAGKSMLVDALALLLGDRADRAAIRPGAAKAVVEGVVESIPAATRRRLDASGIDAEESLIIRREVTSEGRSRAWINGSPTTIGVLASIGESLVDLHGQHQTIQLLDAETQRSLLDGFGHVEAAAHAVRAAYEELAGLRRAAG